MKCFALLGCAVTICGFLTAPRMWGDALVLPSDLPEFLLHSSQGYLGVYLGEAKDPHSAEIVMVDHDAPASKSGLRVHDVILQLNGKPFDNVEQLRHQLLDMPAGRKISLLISRDGNRLTVTVQLCDRRALQQNAWLHHFSVPPPASNEAGESLLGKPPSRGAAFLDSMIPKTPLYVGADVNPVRTQLADYFGVTRGTGLLVENVDAQSPAAQAGLKAGDVVVKVESQPMTSKNDWVKAIRKHRGHLVQLTVMRNKQEQILAMSAGKPKNN
jgi:S1-C subfamily serine protease